MRERGREMMKMPSRLGKRSRDQINQIDNGLVNRTGKAFRESNLGMKVSKSPVEPSFTHFLMISRN
jgi:hypothetical protein